MSRMDAVSPGRPAWTLDRWRLPLAIVLLSGIFGYYLVNAVRRIHGDTGDFRHFYYAARAMLDGEDPYTSWQHGYIYPPLLAFLYTPLALLPEDAAAAVLLACNFTLLLGAAVLATRDLAERFGLAADADLVGPLVFVGVLLTGDKLRGELQMWQTNTLLLFLFVLSLRWLDRCPAVAGAALGLAFNIKYLPIVLLPYLLLRRRWRTAVAFVIAIPVLALLPAVLSGWDANLRQLSIAYGGVFRLFGGAVEPAQAANIADVRSLMSVSLTSAVARALDPGVPATVLFGVVGAVGLVALLAAARIYRRQGVAFWYRADGAAPKKPLARSVTALEWTTLITAALIFSPQTNTRHYALLLFVSLAAALLLFCPRGRAARWPLIAGVAALALGLILPPGATLFPTLRLWWQTTSGTAWCALLMSGTFLWVGLSDARAVAEEGVTLPSAPASAAAVSTPPGGT